MAGHLLFRAACVCVSLVCGATSALAVVATYDESAQGEISDNRLAPTQLNLGVGINTLKGSMGSLEEGHDLEYVRINVPAGHKVTALLMQSYGGGLDFDGVAFAGLQSGPIFTFDANDAFSHIGDMLGWAHFGPGLDTMPGDDILDDLGTGGQGFTGPLTGSTYTFWIQQTGAPTTYQLGFVVVPEPSTVGLAGVGVCCVFRALRGRGGRRTR